MPYCADARHPGDTFFFICEEDFRLTQRDSQAMPCTQLAEAKRIVQEQGSVEQVDGSDCSPTTDDMLVSPMEIFNLREAKGKAELDATYTFSDGSDISKEWQKSFGQFFTRQAAPGATGHVPEALEDLVKISICADRHDVGDFIWFSWEGSNKKGCRSRPMHAATMIGVSAAGARKLLSLISSGKLPPGHADLVLREYMEHHGKEFGACYLWPSVGHYQSHVSGCEQGLGWRENNWKKSWIMEGTRKKPGHLTTWPANNEHRYLVHFRDRGYPNHIVQVVLPEPVGAELRWLSYDDTDHVDSAEDGPLSSPRDIDETASSKGLGKFTRRQKRQRRRNDMLGKFRIWTATWHEVLLGKKKDDEPVAIIEGPREMKFWYPQSLGPRAHVHVAFQASILVNSSASHLQSWFVHFRWAQHEHDFRDRVCGRPNNIRTQFRSTWAVRHDDTL